MSENNVYEIAKLISNKNVIQKDMSEAMGLVQQMFEEKYISKMNSLISNHKSQATQNPSKEVNLLRAWKEFMPENQQSKMDQIINTVTIMDTFNSMRTEYTTMASQNHSLKQDSSTSKDSSIHDDGIYEIDAKCALRKNSMPSGAMPLMLMMLFSGINL